MKLRSEYKDAFLEKHGVKLGLMSGFVKVRTVICWSPAPLMFVLISVSG